MIYLSFARPILSVLLTAATLTGLAQHPDTLKVRNLREVIVTGDRIARDIIPVQTLSGKELEHLSAHSVADAIRYFAGVQVKDYGGIGGLKTIDIRGLGTQHTGVFYDGIELGNAQNGIVDLGRFSMENMMSISLYNGQKTNIFQPAKDFASAASIYMVSRIPAFTDSMKDNIKASLKAGSFGTIEPSIVWEHKLSDHISASLSAGYMYTTGRYKFSYQKKDGYDTSEWRQNGDVSVWRAEAALFGKIKDGEWKLRYYFYNSARGYPGAAVREEPGRFTHQDRQWDVNSFVQASFVKSYGKFYSLQLNGKYAYDYLHYLSDPRVDLTTMYVDNRYRQQEFYLSSANLFAILPCWNVNFSMDLLGNSLRADLVDFVYPRRYTGLAALASSFHFGGIKMQASLLGSFVKEDSKIPGPEAPGRKVYTPSFIFSYKPWPKEDLNFRAFYKRIFRMPSLNDLYYTFIGNKDLNPEYTTQYNAGLHFTRNYAHTSLSRIEAGIDAYFNQVKNKIIAMPTSNQFRWTMINLGYVEVRGIDVTLQTDWQPTKDLGFDTRLNYTYQKAQDFTNPLSPYYGGQIPYLPWHSGSFILGSSYRPWSLNYSMIYTGERYESVANIPENYSRPWYTHDISVSRSVSLNKISIKITTAINNMFNQQYEVVQWYPMPGINFKLILHITL